MHAPYLSCHRKISDDAKLQTWINRKGFYASDSQIYIYIYIYKVTTTVCFFR
jgi:hypothetical protein